MKHITGTYFLPSVYLIYVFQVQKLEKNSQQLQMNLASSHQKHKTDLVKLEDQIRSRDSEIADSRRRVQDLEEQIIRKEDTIRKSESDLLVTRDDVKAKCDEVG